MDNNREELSLQTPIEDLEKRLLSENDTNEIKNIVELFNLNIQKKNIIRVNKLNNLQDKVYNQIEKRLEKYPDNFSNKDLLDYFKTIQDTVDKTDISTENIKAPTIQINQQNNINLNGDQLNAESKRKVAETVRAILNKYQNINYEEISKDDN